MELAARQHNRDGQVACPRTIDTNKVGSSSALCLDRLLVFSIRAGLRPRERKVRGQIGINKTKGI